MSQKIGRIAQVIGAVVDVCFDADESDGKVFLPAIYEALKVEAPDGRELVLEVQQHIGDDTVRTVAWNESGGNRAPDNHAYGCTDKRTYDERCRCAYRWSWQSRP